MDPAFLFLIGAVGVLIAVVVLVYMLDVYNDMGRRLERLRGLMATVRTVRGRRFGVVHVASKGLRGASRHEQQIARLGAQRGRGMGRHAAVTDNANRWPNAAAVGTANQGVTLAVDSLDRETAAWHQLQREAEEYNALLRSFPRGAVAQSLGFRPWSFVSPRRDRSSGRAQAKRYHPRRRT